ncbi:MAG: polysulfide reductase [Desulfuromonas sp.]|nr:MAG: polysulfide reductase [Desulfuromonas sp.]
MTQRAETAGLTLNAMESMLVDRLKSGSNAYYFALLVTGLMMLAGAIAGLQATVGGHHVYYGVSRQIPWGILISTYVYFAITSTGICLVSSIGHIFGVKAYMPIAKRAVFLSIITLSAGFLVIAAEIKVPIRMLVYNIISPNFTSNIWWMGALYGLALGVMIFEFIFLLLGKYKLAVACGFVAVVGELAANSNLAGVFGLLNGREFWHGPYLPIFFIASGVMVGCSCLILFHLWAERINEGPLHPGMPDCLSAIRKVAILMICVIAFFTIWRTVATLAGHPDGQYVGVMAMLTGEYSLSFWGGEILLSLLIPLGLYLFSKGTNMKLMLTAAILMLIGVFFMRHNMVIVGQVIPVFQGLGVTGSTELLKYSPTVHELMIVVGGFGFVGFMFLLGEKIFNGYPVEDHH